MVQIVPLGHSDCAGSVRDGHHNSMADYQLERELKACSNIAAYCIDRGRRAILGGTKRFGGCE